MSAMGRKRTLDYKLVQLLDDAGWNAAAERVPVPVTFRERDV